jgi:hypothetical protein
MTPQTVPVNRIPVESSSLSSVNYYPAMQMLEVEFQSGSVYVYFDVPASTYKALLRADSMGRYFIQNIRSQYRFQRIS